MCTCITLLIPIVFGNNGISSWRQYEEVRDHCCETVRSVMKKWIDQFQYTTVMVCVHTNQKNMPMPAPRGRRTVWNDPSSRIESDRKMWELYLYLFVGWIVFEFWMCYSWWSRTPSTPTHFAFVVVGFFGGLPFSYVESVLVPTQMVSTRVPRAAPVGRVFVLGGVFHTSPSLLHPPNTILDKVPHHGSFW